MWVAMTPRNRTATSIEAASRLADKIGMTRFEPPQISHNRSADYVEAAPAPNRRGPRPLPGIRGMSVRRVIGKDGMLNQSLPWPSGTAVDISLAGGEDA
jgi:hypothetical protein